MNYMEIIRNYREEHDILQKDIAEQLKISKSLYNKYEKNYNTIPLKYLIEVANFLNISIDYALGFNKDETYQNLNCLPISKEIVSRRLKEFRKMYKITQLKLADFLKTNQSVIANYENTRTLISTPFLYEICKKYKVSADYLLGRVEEVINFE